MWLNWWSLRWKPVPGKLVILSPCDLQHCWGTSNVTDPSLSCPATWEDAHAKYSWALMWWRRSSEVPGLDVNIYVIRCCEAFLLKNTETCCTRPHEFFFSWWSSSQLSQTKADFYTLDHLVSLQMDEYKHVKIPFHIRRLHFFAQWEATYISIGCSLPQAWPNRSCGQTIV